MQVLAWAYSNTKLCMVVCTCNIFCFKNSLSLKYVVCRRRRRKKQPMCLWVLQQEHFEPSACFRESSNSFWHCLFCLHCLAKGVFSPDPPYCGYFVPSHFHYHVVNPRSSRCNLLFYEYLKPVNYCHFIVQYFTKILVSVGFYLG